MSKYLSTTQFRMIEEDVEGLINAYSVNFSPIDKPPVPVEMIAERLLELRCDVTDLKHSGRNVLGILQVPEKRILIEEKCSRTQFYFTISHEIGHWRLHQPQLQDRIDSFIDTSITISSMLRSASMGKRRKSTKSVRQESEANRYAAALLIPRVLIMPMVVDLKVINSDAIYRLTNTFQTSALTMLYRIYYLEKNEEHFGPYLDKDSLHSVEVMEYGRTVN